VSASQSWSEYGPLLAGRVRPRHPISAVSGAERLVFEKKGKVGSRRRAEIEAPELYWTARTGAVLNARQ